MQHVKTRQAVQPLRAPLRPSLQVRVEQFYQAGRPGIEGSRLRLAGQVAAK